MYWLVITTELYRYEILRKKPNYMFDNTFAGYCIYLYFYSSNFFHSGLLLVMHYYKIVIL